MNLLIIGGGGREHALAWKLAQSPRVTKIFCAPGNAGTAQLGENVPLAITDTVGLLNFAKDHAIDLTVVGPDDALAAGIVDHFQAAGLRIFGPTREAARLEWSKIFTKEFLLRHGIPTAAAGRFERSADAHRFCTGKTYPLVIKADGLATGKGVIVAEHPAACGGSHLRDDGARTLRRGGACHSHRGIFARPRMLGTRFDRRQRLPSAAAGAGFQARGRGRHGREHRRHGRGQPAGHAAGRRDRAAHPQRDHAADDGRSSRREHPFSGDAFPGLMLTPTGPQVLEFNARFGDPETQVLLPRLQTDLLSVLEAVIDGRLNEVALAWDPRPAVCVILASGGYPAAYPTGKPITGLDELAAQADPDVFVFHAGTRLENGQTVTAGGRVVGVTALGSDLAEARARAYAAAERINFEGRYLRRDIAAGPGVG